MKSMSGREAIELARSNAKQYRFRFGAGQFGIEIKNGMLKKVKNSPVCFISAIVIHVRCKNRDGLFLHQKIYSAVQEITGWKVPKILGAIRGFDYGCCIETPYAISQIEYQQGVRIGIRARKALLQK